ncbi:MAG: hypothetical protein Q7V05_15790 [Methanoregula sp.]|nr:hypothetical protein [Methanoregula sp.]
MKKAKDSRSTAIITSIRASVTRKRVMGRAAVKKYYLNKKSVQSGKYIVKYF